MNLIEVCTRVGVSHTTIYRWIKQREFPRPKRGKWDASEVEAWLLANEDQIDGQWRA